MSENTVLPLRDAPLSFCFCIYLPATFDSSSLEDSLFMLGGAGNAIIICAGAGSRAVCRSVERVSASESTVPKRSRTSCLGGVVLLHVVVVVDLFG